MKRLFTLLSAMAITMIIIAGTGVYSVSTSEIKQAKQGATATLAKSVALSISAQINMLNLMLDKMAHDPELIAAIQRRDRVLISEIAERLQGFLPGAMKLRVLLPGESTLDNTSVPHMGYADLEMVKATFNTHQLPLIQGDKGENRHLAVTRQIIHNDQVIGVFLASLKYDFLKSNVDQAKNKHDLIELKQSRLVLNSSGDQQLKQSGEGEQIKVAETSWEIHYWFSDIEGALNLSLLAGVIIIPLFIAGLGFLVAYRRLAEMLRGDQSSVLKAAKDLMTGKPQGNYPINIDEMRLIISNLIQFKRVLDNGGINAGADVMGDDDDLLLDDFFDEPAGVNFATASQGIDVQENEVEAEMPVTLPESAVEKESVAASFQATDIDETTDLGATIFRAYDIRGIVDQTLTSDVVYNIGRALGSEAKDQGISTVVIARDGRLSSPALAESLAKGIMTTGRNIMDLGMVPTPVLYFVVQHTDGRTGVMITGSHNPVNYNGLKMVVNGDTLAGEKIQALKQRIDREDFATGELGTLEQNTMFVNEYIGIILEDVHIARPMKVVLDCGNGVTGELGPTLLKTLGCEVIELFTEIDGNFPNHHPDPSKPENLNELITSVKHYEADVGIAFDGDGDRLGVVDSKGKIIWPDRQMMLFARDVLAQKPGAEIIYDVKCSRHLADQIVKHGGRPVMWKTGHSFIKAKLKETAAKLAGEMSGHIFFNDRWFGFDDAMYSAARLIEILSADTRPSSEVFAEFPDSFNTPELNVDLTEGENFKFMDELIARTEFSDGKITDIDGMRVDFADGWGLVRASNTMPSLVLRFEADSNEALLRIQEQFKNLMLEIKPDLTLPF